MGIEHEIPEDWAPATLRQEMTFAARAMSRVILRLRDAGNDVAADALTYLHDEYVRECGEILE